jgi:hypothetical protein
MHIGLLLLAIPAALIVRYLRRRPPMRKDAAEILRWWGTARGLGDPAHPIGAAPASEAGFDPLDVALGSQIGAQGIDSERLSEAVPTHAITLQGSALFHTGDRQRVHAAVEGKLDDTLDGTVMLITCEQRDERGHDWHWLCDLTAVAIESVKPQGAGLLVRRHTAGGGARVAVPEGYEALTLESAELDALYDVRLAAGCDPVAAREALTPAVIAWLCERAPEALVLETGGASVRLATAGLLSSDSELDAFTADACWLAHALIEATPVQVQQAA